ncbi:MAG: Ig-like domain-containing protein [Coprobacillus sp.]|nr:Ig-like domain-containing protein [Coprobacillus sp.]
MTKTKKIVLWSLIGCLCVALIAGTAIGVSYSQYRSATSSNGLVSIPKWDFDLTTSNDATFDVETSTKLSPDQSIYTEGNTNRYSVSLPIATAKITNKGEVSGDISVCASLNQTNPYNPNSKYQANETFENEFLDHFSLTPYYSLDGEKLTEISEDSLITLYPESEVGQDNSLYNYIYIYVTVTWLSDIDDVNGDAFDTWVGRYIDSINLSISFKAIQHGEFSPTQSNAKLGVQVSDYECLYFDGTLDSSGHLNTTSNYEKAVELIIAELKENEYTLGFYASDINPTSYYASETLTYIGYSGSSTGGFTLTSDPYIWLYDDDYDVFFTYDDNGTQRFIGNQSGSDYLGCYAWSNINSSSYNKGSSFESEPELQEAPSTPQEGDKTYKLGVLDSDTYKYFSGTVSSNHMNTTTSYEEALDIYITPLNDGEDYTCTLSFYDTDEVLQYIASSENSSNMKLTTTPYTWTWKEPSDGKDGYFYTASFSDRFIGHQSGYDYFACYANSNAGTNNYQNVLPYSDDPDLNAPESIIVTADQGKTEIELGGHGLQLYASVSPSSGVNQHVIWSSSDETIASVDQTGLVSPISEGEVIIYATSEADSNIKGEYPLTVIGESELVYKEKEEFVASDIYSSVGSGENVTISDDLIYGDLVTISFAANGGGTAPHYYDNGNDYRIYSKNQIIFTPVDEMVAEISKIELVYSGSYYGNDTATFTDTNGNEAGTITNPKTSGGTITIDVSASGEVIYCNDYSSNSGGTQLRCTDIVVYYEKPNDIVPDSITITGDSNEIEVGQSLQLGVEISPAEASQKVVWSSSNESVASVSQTGLVKALSEGDTTIKAVSALSDQIYGTYLVSVNAKEVGDLPEVKIGTYDFTTKDETFSKANGSTSVMSTTQLKDTLDAYWTSEDDYDNPLSSVNSTNYIYQYYTSGGLHSGEYNLLKTGGSSNTGTMDLTMTDTITKVEIDQQSWSESENCKVSVNTSADQQSASEGVQETLTFDIDDATNLQMTFNKRCYIYSITIYGYVY